MSKSNWDGQGLVFPRSLFAEVRRERADELKRAGVYVLWGPGGESGQLPHVYVGEGDGVLPRLDQHAKSKEFWTRAAVFVSRSDDQSLNKAHVQYIESQLVALAHDAKRCELDNGNVPQEPALSEADRTDAKAFLDSLLLCLPIVGMPEFEKPHTTGRSDRDLFLRRSGIEARGLDSAEGFIVRADSTAVLQERPSIAAAPYLLELRRTLAEKGVMTMVGEVFRFAQDYTFSSPSTAAGVLLACSTNGRLEWRDANRKSLKDIEEQVTDDS